MLAVRLDAFEAYQRDEAWTWEHMALLRARPIYGTEAGQGKVSAAILRVLGMKRDRSKVRSDAAKMRADMARHKPPAGPLDIKLGPGGLVDLEFAVHVLQLSHGLAFDPRLEVAIEALAIAGLINRQPDADLRLLSRILVTSRLVVPGGGVPHSASQALVAEACGYADWASLLEAHDAARQRMPNCGTK